MRVVNSSVYNKFTSSVNDVHGKLNKAMNKVSSGAAYENAAENPLAYYQGKHSISFISPSRVKMP